MVFDSVVPLWDHATVGSAHSEPQGDPEIWRERPNARGPLDRWYGVAKRATWVSFAEAKESFNAADSVAPFVIIDIGGNKFRLIAEINFIRRVLFIRRIMTHKEYTKGAWRT